MTIIAYFRRLYLLIIATPVLCSLLAVSCLSPIDNEQPREPFQFSIAGSAVDTVSPFGPLLLRFTRPVRAPDSVRFMFSPSFTEYQIMWNISHDTARIYFARRLECKSNYGIVPANRITATDGSVLSPWKDTLTFSTHYCEQEPNDSRDLTDLLRGTVFGQMTMANDTDWFKVSDTAKREFYLKSTGSASSFAIRDARGMSAAPQIYASAETLSAPIDFIPPLYLTVYPHNHSNGGTYELGWTGR